MKFNNLQSCFSNGIYFKQEKGVVMKSFGVASLSILLVANLAWASNGSYLIGVTPQSQAMGGTGTGLYTSDGNALFRNAALLVKEKTATPGMAEGSLTKMWPGVRTKYGQNGEERRSTVGIPLIPQLSAGYQPCDYFSGGLGVFTFAGNNLNFANAVELDYLKTYARYTRLVLGLAVKPVEFLSLSVSPNLGFGALEINSNEIPFGQSGRKPAKDTAFGAQFGVAAFPTEALTVGIQYSLKQRFMYESVLDLQRFDATLLNEGSLDTFTVDLPRQLNVGVGYEFTDLNTRATADMLWIEWAEAKGTKDLQWRNQYVWALGVETALNAWKIRAGFNYGRSVVTSREKEDGIGVVDSQGSQITTQARSSFSVVGFPAQATTHYTVGAGYSFNSEWSADFAFVYSPKKSLSRSGTTLGTAFQYTTTGRQISLAAGGTYRF